MSSGLLSAVFCFVLTSPALGAADDHLVVHEWGTLTSFSGSDGVQLEFRPLVGNDLPSFVYDRARQAGAVATPGEKGQISATQRMETPVIYFYTGRAREVDVRVDFPHGLLTEFYPPVTAISPPYTPGAPSVKDGSLHWTGVRLIPGASPAFPADEAGTHYAVARATDATPIQTSGSHGEHVEKFLFYRGVGNFSIPVTLRAEGGGQFTVDNSLDQPVAAAFLIEVSGGKIRAARVGELRGSRSFGPLESHSADSVAGLLERDLLEAGLFAREARAMLDTWRAAWLAEEGTRMLYLLPAEFTDRILPLAVQPAPEKLVRVMVGRFEILTPEWEARLERELTSSSPDDYPNCRLFPTLAGLGRFQVPAVRRILVTTRDQSVRSAAQQILAQLGDAGERVLVTGQ